MRVLTAIPALFLTGAALGGCSTSAPPGVLPRDPVPPPPSLTGSIPKRTATAERASPSVQRRALSVPERIVTPRPASIRVEPVTTGSGAGAGFRF